VCVYTHTHTHTEYYSAIKKNEILPFATTWIELEGIMLSEISQSEKDKYHTISLMWNLRNKTKAQRKKRERERQTRRQTMKNKLIVTRGEVGGGMG